LAEAADDQEARAMIKKMGLLLGCLLWTTPGFSQNQLSTQDFVTDAAMSNMAEIQASKAALDRQPDADTKPFARKMVKDHEKISRQLKALIDSGKVKASLPTALDSEHQQQLSDLEGKSGSDFDHAYDQMQLQAHEKAVSLFQEYAKTGDNPRLKAWAAKTLPHLKGHLEMAKNLK
jgi:putative membrane protein